MGTTPPTGVPGTGGPRPVPYYRGMRRRGARKRGCRDRRASGLLCLDDQALPKPLEPRREIDQPVISCSQKKRWPGEPEVAGPVLESGHRAVGEACIVEELANPTRGVGSVECGKDILFFSARRQPNKPWV